MGNKKLVKVSLYHECKEEHSIDLSIITRGLGRLDLVPVETLVKLCTKYVVYNSRSGKVKSYEVHNFFTTTTQQNCISKTKTCQAK